MARTQLDHPVRTLQGKLAKDERIIFRQKTSHSSIKSGIDYPQEVYVIAHPRDYKKNPPRGNELAHLQAFRQACLLTKQQLADPGMRTAWEQRFQAQLSCPDADAPIDPYTGKRKIYRHFPSYVRAALLRQSKTPSATE